MWNAITADNNTLTRTVWVVLAVLILVGTGLRLVQWDARSLWQDEVFTMSLATGNPLFEATLLPDEFEADPKMPQPPAYYRSKANQVQSGEAFLAGLQHNVQMPLYPLLVRGIAKTLTNHPVHIRLLSILAGVLCIPAAFFLGRELMHNRLGFIMAILFTLSGFQLIYSQTARVYALLTLMTLIASWFLIRLCKNPDSSNRQWVLFAVISVLGLYSHYFYVFILAFHGLWLGYISLDTVQLRKKAVWSALAIVLCALPAGFLLLEQLAFLKTIGHGNLQGLWDPLNLIERLWNHLTSMISPKDTITKILITALAGLGVISCLRKQTPQNPLVFAILWLMVLVGGIIAVDVISDTHRIMSKRYLILASPAITLLVAYGLATRSRKLGITCAVVLLILMVHNSYEVLSGAKFLRKENYRGAGLVIQEQANKHDLVLVSHSGVHAAGMAFYMPDRVVMSGVSRRNAGTMWDADSLSNHLNTVTQGRDHVWIVFTHVKPPVLAQQIDGWMNLDYEKKDTRKFSSVRLEHYVRKP